MPPAGLRGYRRGEARERRQTRVAHTQNGKADRDEGGAHSRGVGCAGPWHLEILGAEVAPIPSSPKRGSRGTTSVPRCWLIVVNEIRMAVCAAQFEESVLGRAPGVDHLGDVDASVLKDQRAWRLLAAMGYAVLHTNRNDLSPVSPGQTSQKLNDDPLPVGEVGGTRRRKGYQPCPLSPSVVPSVAQRRIRRVNPGPAALI
jgi:hypothetical protein